MNSRNLRVILACVGAVLCLNTFAQKGGPAVFSVAGDTVWGAEFERVFNKNNKTPHIRPSDQEILDYRDLYVRFKLKVNEAYALGMDTNEQFVKELEGYRKQLAQPYLTDKGITERLIKEAYERMQYEVEASNLMIALSPAASPADTLAAFKRISKWREKIASGDVTFDRLTRDSSLDDHGRKAGGKLGYFSAFNMIYKFENQAYTTKVGEMSEVFRTQYGYHVVFVTDKRPARGDLKVAHILIRINKPTEYESTKPRIDAIYERLQKGESFESLVLDFTEDYATREAGGQLNWIKSVGGNVPKDFKEAAYALNDGAYSQPIKTELGWHIIKRIEARPLASFDDMKETIKFKISRDSRSALNKDAVVKRVQDENGFMINQPAVDKYMASLTDSLALTAAWKPDSFYMSDEMLFSIADQIYSFADFTQYLQLGAGRAPGQAAQGYAIKEFNDYCALENLVYEESILETKYEDFKYLMQEYKDGILLFELTNKMVWQKATEDTAGMNAFFEANRDKYQWKKRVKTTAYVCSNKGAYKLTKKLLKKDFSVAQVIDSVNRTDALALKVRYKTFEAGQDETIDALNWDKTRHYIKDKQSNIKTILFIDEVLAPSRKEMNETLGPLTSDYQNHLEDLWIESLKVKYPVVIFDGVIDKLFSNLN